MSLRQKIKGNPAVIAAFAVVLIGVTGWFSFQFTAAWLDEAAVPGVSARIGAAQTAVATSNELKKPGQSVWIRMTDFRNASAVMATVCPPGEEDLVAIHS